MSTMPSSSRIIPVTHIITDLNTGGAETMLLRLLGSIDRTKFPSRVISLSDNGPIGNQIADLGIPVFNAKMEPNWQSISGFTRIVHEIKKNPPGLVQTWMYHADLIGGLATRVANSAPVIWGIHNSTLDPLKSKASTRAIVRLNAFLSSFLPEKIIACSQAARFVHLQAGYSRDKIVFIPNGFDLSEFKPDPQARMAIRKDFGIDGTGMVIGMAARYDPQKDHATFFNAASVLLKKFPEIHFVLCGDGITLENAELMKMILPLEAGNHIHLLGRRSDMPEILASWDIAVLSSSFGEAFPLVIGEAMACGIPCVGTDVGDTSDLIGETGAVVPARQPGLLAIAIEKILSLSLEDRLDLGKAARSRVKMNYEIEFIADMYQNVWLEAVSK